MIGRSLAIYFVRRFAGWILGMFVGIFLLVFLIDCIELLRSNGGRDDVSCTHRAPTALKPLRVHRYRRTSYLIY